MISFSDVNRFYHGIPAVENVSFTIDKGEVVGMLGHNGAGKTTIMKMMTGFLEPTSGTIEIDGLTMEKDRGKIKEKIGYLPENCPVYNDMLVFDYLCHAGLLHGIPASEIEQRVIDAMKLTELGSRADRRLSTLSRGYRQRVGVAQAILHKPDILVLDEPTNGLDPTQILQMRSLVRDLAKQSTIIISTHILQEVQAVCDRVIIIRNGRKAMDASLADLQSSHRIAVETDMASERFFSLFGSMNGVKAVRKTDGNVSDNSAASRYLLELSDDADVERCSSMAASEVIENGASLFALFPETRDLETIFGEITSKEEVTEL